MSNNVIMPKAKLGKNGWGVQWSAGPLADAIAHLAGHQPVIHANGAVATIPYTQQLDRYIVGLVDALIHLRYDANRVKLTLADAIEMEARDD